MRRFRNGCFHGYRQMPIYEYRCDNCGHEFETIQKVSDPLLKTCPACEKEALRKKVSVAGFRLKGGGWYETDFKSDKKRNVAGEDRSDGGKSEGAKNGGEAAKGGEKASADGGSSKSSGEAGSGSDKKGGKSGGEGKGGASGSKSSE